ncbi:hypothetical protein VPH35_056280 [Triticum aestivum]
MSFLAPPATQGKPGFPFPSYPPKGTVRQSCNGLLLLHEEGEYYVLNPATAHSLHLPYPSAWRDDDFMSLAFDPAVSLHYHVLSLGQVQEERAEEPKEKVVPMLVYSSLTRQWEHQEFAPGYCAPGQLYNAVARSPDEHKRAFFSSNYWRGSIYMHCHNNVVMTLRPSKGTYGMVQLPGQPCSAKRFYDLPTNSVLASYERGVHYVAINILQLRVWMLTESMDGQLGWTLAHDVNLNPDSHITHPQRGLMVQSRVTWRVVESSGETLSLTKYDNRDAVEDEDGADGSECSWNSDEDNFVDVVGSVVDDDCFAPWGYMCRIMGFHPYKNALILRDLWTVVVYHLDTSRMQYLGEIVELYKDEEEQCHCVYGSFTYRPCYKDVLPGGELSVPS